MPKRRSPVEEPIAMGFGLAAFHLQNALLTTLAAKGLLTMKEAAIVAKGAAVELKEQRVSGADNELMALAQQALDTLADRWEKQAKGN